MGPKSQKNIQDSKIPLPPPMTAIKKLSKKKKGIKLKIIRTPHLQNPNTWKPNTVKIHDATDSKIDDGFLFGNIKLQMSYKAYKHEMPDFTLITNFESKEFLPEVPKLEKFIEHRWIHGIAPAPIGSGSPIRRGDLKKLNDQGKIFAFKFFVTTLAGEPVVYFGAVPTVKMDIEFTPGILTAEVYVPRKAIIEYLIVGLCGCSDGCRKIKVRLFDKSIKICCSKRVPWRDVMIICGDYIEDEDLYLENMDVRDCKVCAACGRCGIKNRFCTLHVKCRHRHKSVPQESIDKLLAESNNSLNVLKEFLDTFA